MDLDLLLGRFGDRRLEKRGAWALGRAVAGAGREASVSGLGGNRTGEMRLRRFLENASVEVEEMVAQAAIRTASASAGRHVLAIQDTTAARSDPSGGGGPSALGRLTA